MEPGLKTHVGGGTATVTISNTGKRNAMTVAMWRELPPLLERLAGDQAVRALVLTGDGGTFCAGADIGSLRDGADGSQGLAVAAEEALADFPRPTVAAVRGYCVGGGAQLAAACDLRFAEEGALFGVTPAKLGVAYPASATRRLVRLVGPSAAKYLLFSGELIDCARALRTGLVDEVVPEGELDKRIGEFGAVLASRSLLTQTAAKELADGTWDVPPEEAAARGAYWAAQARESGETAEGAVAFLERRAPRFGWSEG
ncbi:enoyl-CoA hydratase/isomerase family protein [Streptomyces sp. S186]|uniref:enoyl-CoA hydratase/isomerase family protein n=1 Tax=Streptomyces sp. S186 TaxID=3434395 RepID=UPI003F678A62